MREIIDRLEKFVSFTCGCVRSTEGRAIADELRKYEWKDSEYELPEEGETVLGFVIEGKISYYDTVFLINGKWFEQFCGDAPPVAVKRWMRIPPR